MKSVSSRRGYKSLECEIGYGLATVSKQRHCGQSLACMDAAFVRAEHRGDAAESKVGAPSSDARSP